MIFLGGRGVRGGTSVSGYLLPLLRPLEVQPLVVVVFISADTTAAVSILMLYDYRHVAIAVSLVLDSHQDLHPQDNTPLNPKLPKP